MRPSIRGMLDGKMRIWRPRTSSDAIAIEERTYDPVAVVDCFINRPKTPEVPAGGGLAPTGTVRWYGMPNIDVHPRDVCEVIAGADVGRTWEVNEPPTQAPKNHHTQVDCIEWNGTLPSLEPQS